MEQNSKAECVEINGAIITPTAANKILGLQYGIIDPKDKSDKDVNGFINGIIYSIDIDINWLIQKRDELFDDHETRLLDILENLSDYRELVKTLVVPKNI